jgi:integrase/recombinase XerD
MKTKEQELKRFEKYLLKKNRTPSTTKGYLVLLSYFIEWCRVFKVNFQKATLEELYDYQSYNRSIGNKPHTLQSKISVLREYYRFLGRKNNPALLMETEKPEKKLPKNLLTEESLLNLYLDCPVKSTDEISFRNKIMFSMFIFQGLTRSELDILEVEHIDFEKRRLYVPANGQRNRRYIDLNPIQKRDLEKYVNQTRNELLVQYNKTTGLLFFSTSARHGDTLLDIHNIMLRDYKKQMPDLVSFIHIRQSRMALWVNEFGIRKAQYLSGIKYVTSLIRYRSSGHEKLKQKLNIIHPLERLKLD